MGTQNTGKSRIYVASLADYTAGRLLGRWIDAAQPAEAIHAEVAAMLAESMEPIAEEWAIHDHEGFGSLRLGEYETIDNVAEVANLIEEHGPVFAELVGHFGGTSDVDEAKRYMEDGYRGEFDRVDCFVEEFVEDCYGDVLKQLPDFLRYHIDFEGIARDMEMGGDIFTVESEGKVHVFWANC
jgi:antirestriction protein